MKTQIEALQTQIANAWRNNEIKLWNSLRSELEVLIISSL